MLKKYSGWLMILFAAGILAFVNLNVFLDLGDFKLHHDQSGGEETISLPLSRVSPSANSRYEVNGKISFRWAASRILHITPDDEVKRIVINGKEADLSAIPADRLRDWQNGFSLDVGPYVHKGQNDISIVFDDYGGNMGMAINPGGWRIEAICILWLVLALIAVVQAHSIFKIPRSHAVLYALIILGTVLQIWVIYTYNPLDHIFSDAQRHWEQGTDLFRNDLMSNTDPILYQLYIGFLAKLSLDIPGLVAFYTSLLAFIGTWTWYRFFRELQGNKTLSLAGWAFVSLLPSWMSIYSYFMQETLLLPLLGAALWATWRARRKATVGSFAWMVILWILAGLTRGIAIPLAAVCCTALWLTQGQRLKKALVSTGILLFVLGPLTYRSYQTVHHFAPNGMGHLVSIYAKSGKREIQLTVKKGGYAVYGFGSPSIDERPFKPFSDWTSQRKGKIHIDVDLDKGREDWDKAAEQVSMSWKDALWITKENLIFLFFGPSWPDNNESRTVDFINVQMRWIWAPAFLAAIIWCFRMRKRLGHQWLLPALILTWFTVQGVLPISLNEGRYRKPFEGLIIAQIILLTAASRGQAKAGRPYNRDLEPLLATLANLMPKKRKPSLPDTDEPRSA